MNWLLTMPLQILKQEAPDYDQSGAIRQLTHSIGTGAAESDLSCTIL